MRSNQTVTKHPGRDTAGGADRYARYALHLSRALVDEVLHYTHWIPNQRGMTRQFFAEHYPGWDLPSMVAVFDTAAIRVHTEPCAPHGGKCHWKVKALHFNNAEDFEVEWDEEATEDDGKFFWYGEVDDDTAPEMG
jgi:hypothetical protein